MDKPLTREMHDAAWGRVKKTMSSGESWFVLICFVVAGGHLTLFVFLLLVALLLAVTVLCWVCELLGFLARLLGSHLAEGYRTPDIVETKIVLQPKAPTRLDQAKRARDELDEELRMAEFIDDPTVRSAAVAAAQTKFRRKMGELMQ